MASIRKQIMDGIESALATTPGVLGVYRSRVIAFQREESPCVYIRALGETPLPLVHPFTNKDFSFEVGVIVRAAAVDVATDDIGVEVHNRILSEPTIGGLALDTIEEGTVFEEEDADGGASVLRMRFKALYRHYTETLDQQ